MTLALGCVADDYTGASDLANTLSKAGLRTVQTIGVPPPSLALPEIDAVVIALKIRSVQAGEAVARAREARAWLVGRGARHVMYKVCSTFDSTDAGNIGPVGDAFREDAGEPIVLVTPAFPETGRTVYQGNLFVGSLPLAESPLKDHPLNPMRDSSLVRVLDRQSRAPVGLVPLADVERGPERVRDCLSELARKGCGAAVADAVFDRDLDVLGAATFGAAVSVGASGLGLGLARALLASGRVAARAGAAQSDQPVGGYAACLAGSCSAATLAQVEQAAATMPTCRIDVQGLLEGRDEVGRALAWGLERLAAGPILISSSETPSQVSAVQSRYGVSDTGHAVEAAMASISERLVAAGVRRLVVAGGETSGAVVDRLAIPAFVIGPEIAPGVPVLDTVPGEGPPMRFALKSGNFGGPGFFADALRIMT